jgi:hypothetical protein
MNMLACEDYMAVIPRVLVEPLPKFAQDVLIRAAVESAGRAWWLLNPTADARNRAARGLLHLLTSAKEAVNSVQVSGSEEDLRMAEAKLAEVLCLANEHQFVVEATGRSYVVDGTSRPSSTKLMEGFLGKAGLLQFKDLSGVAHGHSHSLVERYRSTGEDLETNSVHLEPSID